jgi:Ca2+-binding RTX toxin-like protein
VFFGAAGQGNSTYICGSGADLLGMGQGTNYVALGSGYDVVFGNPGTMGASFIVAGSGSADIGLGGATNAFYVGTGTAARSFNLFNFSAGADTLVLNGLPSSAIGAAIAGQTIVNQSDTLTVGGNTTITLIGVTAPVTAAFFGPQAAPPTFPVPPGLLG